ncbi:Fc.00g027210.m01.CDS01 [Cosmosporella sp. VM-42]
MKDQSDVITEFNELVNMTATELEKWLKSDDSNSAGWPKEDEKGETVGHDSGRKIVEILKANPERDPENYDEDQVAHIRKVVSYCKRHLAQETKGNKEKSPEEVKKTKSYASLKNWGHDFLKAQGEKGQEDKGDDEEQDAVEEKEEDENKVGDKRKTSNGQSGTSKRRETQKGGSKKSNDDEEESEEVSEEDPDDTDDDEEVEEGEKSNGQSFKRETEKHKGKNDAKLKKGPKKGQTVTWNWGGGQPEGKVLDVKGEKTSITTKNGNQVSRKGDPEDPAVVLDTGKSKAIKANHELN